MNHMPMSVHELTSGERNDLGRSELLIDSNMYQMELKLFNDQSKVGMPP